MTLTTCMFLPVIVREGFAELWVVLLVGWIYVMFVDFQIVMYIDGNVAANPPANAPPTNAQFNATANTYFNACGNSLFNATGNSVLSPPPYPSVSQLISIHSNLLDISENLPVYHSL